MELTTRSKESKLIILEDMASFRFALSRVTLLYEINQARISTLEKVAIMQALLVDNF